MIRILVTGGTFDKEYDELSGELFFKDTHVREMLRLGRCELELDVRMLMMIDSIDMTDSDRAAILAGCVCWFLLKIASKYHVEHSRHILLTAGIVLGTFMWTNLTFAGAWQLALGFAMVGELGAIYFTVYDRRPLIAGIFFAMAFGNRTENLLTAPVLMYLLCRGRSEPTASAAGQLAEAETTKDMASVPPTDAGSSDMLRRLAAFARRGDRAVARAVCAGPA